MTKNFRTLMAAMMLLTTGAAALLMPTAQAHYCQSSTPTGCGNCGESGRPHIHNWTLAGRRILEMCSSNLFDGGFIGHIGILGTGATLQGVEFLP